MQFAPFSDGLAVKPSVLIDGYTLKFPRRDPKALPKLIVSLIRLTGWTRKQIMNEPLQSLLVILDSWSAPEESSVVTNDKLDLMMKTDAVYPESIKKKVPVNKLQKFIMHGGKTIQE